MKILVTNIMSERKGGDKRKEGQMDNIKRGRRIFLYYDITSQGTKVKMVKNSIYNKGMLGTKKNRDKWTI